MEFHSSKNVNVKSLNTRLQELTLANGRCVLKEKLCRAHDRLCYRDRAFQISNEKALVRSLDGFTR